MGDRCVAQRCGGHFTRRRFFGAGGVAGVALSYAISAAVGTMPLLGPLYEDTSGKADIHLAIPFSTLALSTAILVAVGTLSGLAPALRASRLNPVEALRYE